MNSIQPDLDRKTESNELKRYMWRGKKIQAEPITEQYPVDTQQVPDIFVHIYDRKERIGYVRVSAGDASMSDDNANWYTIQNPQNNFDGKNPGLLLANLRTLKGEATKAPRSNNRYDQEEFLNMYAFVYSCAELAPSLKSEKVRARVEFSFCDLQPNYKIFDEQNAANPVQSSEPTPPVESRFGWLTSLGLGFGGGQDKAPAGGTPPTQIPAGQTGPAPISRTGTATNEKDKLTKKKTVHPMIIESKHHTKNPIFGHQPVPKGEIIIGPAKVRGGIGMAPNLTVKVYNLEAPVMFSSGKYQEIGTCYISPRQCKTVRGIPGELHGVEPTYYTIVGPNGQIQGKILMLLAFSKNLKESMTIEDFHKEMDIKLTRYRLDFSCIGLRNLDSKCPDPEVTLSIPSYQLMIKFKPVNLKKNPSAIDEQNEKMTLRKKQKLMALANIPDTKKKGDKKDESPVFNRKAFVRLGEELVYAPITDNDSYVSNLKDYNPNVCMTNKVAEFLMPENPLFYPRAEIEVVQKNTITMNTEYFTTVDLVECNEHLPKNNINVLKGRLGMIRRVVDALESNGADDKVKVSMNRMVCPGLNLDQQQADFYVQKHY